MLRVNCIFTAISISLSPWPRQCGSRYAIRAGRNLPDKEFRSVLLPPSESPGWRLGRLLFRPALHVAVELGPYLHLPLTQMLDVWPLRIPERIVPSWPFLLIVRTRRFFTAPRDEARVARDPRSFQHIVECTRVVAGSQGYEISNLRTVIVTAAVYRGFGSPLRGFNPPDGSP